MPWRLRLGVNNFESKIIEAIQSVGTKFLDDFFGVVTHLGSVWAVIVVAILFILIFGLRGLTRYLFILGVTTACGALIKIIVARPRPYIFSTEIEGLTSAGGYSFASGHTLTMVITALSIYFMVARILRDTKTADDPVNKKKRKRNIWIKTCLFIFLTFITLLVGFSRIYLGVHYISDVLFAVLLGLVCYYIFAKLYDRYIEKLIFRKGGKKC